jgi:hypothetical protein
LNWPEKWRFLAIRAFGQSVDQPVSLSVCQPGKRFWWSDDPTGWPEGLSVIDRDWPDDPVDWPDTVG